MKIVDCVENEKTECVFVQMMSTSLTADKALDSIDPSVFERFVKSGAQTTIGILSDSVTSTEKAKFALGCVLTWVDKGFLPDEMASVFRVTNNAVHLLAPLTKTDTNLIPTLGLIGEMGMVDRYETPTRCLWLVPVLMVETNDEKYISTLS